MKLLRIAALATAAFVAVPAGAQVTTGQYGDVQIVTAPGNKPAFQLTSDTNAAEPYGGIYFGFQPTLTLSSLTQLSADYQQTIGSFGGGSPRFTLLDEMGGGAYVYFGTPNGNGTFSDPFAGAEGTTGNYADLNSTDARVELNGFGGVATGFPPITFAQAVAQVGSTGIRYVTLDVDGGFTGTQRVLVTKFTVNDNVLAPPAVAAVPEPATWAMMIGGFGIAGAAMRRRATREAGAPQAA